MTIIALIGKIIGMYCLGGAATILITAYWYSRSTGKDWLGKGWGHDPDDFFPPALIFGIWPIVVLIAVVGLPVNAFFTALKAGSKAIENAAQNQRKQIGDFRKNPT